MIQTFRCDLGTGKRARPQFKLMYKGMHLKHLPTNWTWRFVFETHDAQQGLTAVFRAVDLPIYAFVSGIELAKIREDLKEQTLQLERLHIENLEWGGELAGQDVIS